MENAKIRKLTARNMYFANKSIKISLNSLYTHKFIIVLRTNNQFSFKIVYFNINLHTTDRNDTQLLMLLNKH